MTQFIHDPDANLDYGITWAAWLAAVDDTIETSTWIVPEGMTKTDESNTTTTATVWLSGGTVGETYSVVNRISTVQERTDDRTIRITVTER